MARCVALTLDGLDQWGRSLTPPGFGTALEIEGRDQGPETEGRRLRAGIDLCQV